MRQLDALSLVRELVTSAGARVVTVGLGAGAALACAEAGAVAALPSSASVDDLVDVFRSVIAGHAVFAPSVVAQLVGRVSALTSVRTRAPELPNRITNRELQVLELIDDGLSNKEIAARLHVELATVKNHVHRILNKLEVQRRSQAAAAFRATSSSVANVPGRYASS
jgi:two-component system nitrate/nitrite response regulator NarL